jgi:serine protease Do
MSYPSPKRALSLGAVAVAAAALGAVLTGGLDVTPRTAAQPASAAQTAAAAPVAATSLPSFADLAARVVPSVVSVYTEDIIKPQDIRRFHHNMDPFEFFFGPNMGPQQMEPQKRMGAGSGFFISADGLVLTNNHVVEGADEIWAQLAGDDTRLKAKVIGRDPATDIALIKIQDGGPFTPIPLGDSSAIRVGDWVMAVGNPLNMDHTVTVGVVSAKGRTLGLSEETTSFENFIQTDAAINLGNSGGPLVNLAGQVVGINSAINAAGQNLGFAIPINIAKQILPQLEKSGKVVRGYLGVIVQNVDEKLQKAFDLPDRQGAFVQDVEKDGPAAKAGVEKGDDIVGVNGHKVSDTRDLINTVSATAPGDKVALDVVRSGKSRQVTVTLGERPNSVEAGQGAPEGGQTPTDKIGLQIDDLTPRARRMYSVPNDVQGVIVTDVNQVSAAADAGIQEGDIITELNGQTISSVDQFEDALKSAKKGAYLRLYVYRTQSDRGGYVILQMP